jgi:hypothetical protein
VSAPGADATALERLIAKDEIRDVLFRYARGVDRNDPELIAAAFHPDAVGELGSRTVTGAEIVPSITRRTGDFDSPGSHIIGNMLIEVMGDLALSESYFVSVQTIVRDGRAATRFRSGRYIDRFERRANGWRIAHRIVTDDWNRIDDVHEPAVTNAEYVAGVRPDDPLYRMSDAAGAGDEDGG